MMRGGNACGGAADDARDRRQTVLLRRRFRRDDQRRRAVIDARRIARRHRAVLAERRRNLASCLHRGLGARMFVCVDDDRSPLRCGIVTGVISFASRPVFCAAGLGLRAQRESVLVFARHLEVLGDVLAVSGMESTPYCFFITGLMKRQPMVVS
jgi:hypothetical protein